MEPAAGCNEMKAVGVCELPEAESTVKLCPSEDMASAISSVSLGTECAAGCAGERASAEEVVTGVDE